MSKVANGTYSAVVVPVTVDGVEKYAQLGLSKRKGTKQILMMLKLTSGEFKGVALPWFGYFSEDSAERTVQALRLCGFTGQDIFDVETQKMTEQVQVTVENETFEGKTQSRIAWINDPDYVPEIETKPLGKTDRDALKAALKGLL